MADKNAPYPEEVLARASRVKLLLLDVDGVLADGRINLGDAGFEMKGFNSQDGFGLRLLAESGVATGIITARASEAVRRRAGELSMRHLVENAQDKLAAFSDILAQEGLTARDCAYMGDDWIDLPLLNRVGLALAPANAVSEVRRRAHFITERNGGEGAVREACILILRALGRYEQCLARFNR